MTLALAWELTQLVLWVVVPLASIFTFAWAFGKVQDYFEEKQCSE